MKILIALSPLFLSGCFFIYLPGSVTGAISDGLTGSFGNACVSAGAVEGGKVTTPGRGSATVDKISGPSVRCSEPTPIRAQVTYD